MAGPVSLDNYVCLYVFVWYGAEWSETAGAIEGGRKVGKERERGQERVREGLEKEQEGEQEWEVFTCSPVLSLSLSLSHLFSLPLSAAPFILSLSPRMEELSLT